MEKTLGKTISTHRKRLGLTQDQLAEQLGVTAQAVSKWENDISCPDIAMLPKLAGIFGISIDTLLGGDEPEPQVHEGEVVVEPTDDNEGVQFRKGNWQFKMSGGRKNALGFALLVLATGGQLLAARILDVELSFWSALWPVALMILSFVEMPSRVSFFHFGCILFGAYFALDNWNVLPFSITKTMIFPVILVLFGLSLLVDALRKPRKRHFKITRSNDSKHQLSYRDEGFDYNASFSEHSALINLEKLSSGTVTTSFGDFTLDLSGVKKVSKNCHIEATCSFGETTLLVPSRYKVLMTKSCAFAENSISGHPDEVPEGTISLDCSVSFGEFLVKYI